MDKLRELSLLVAIIETGSFAAAARLTNFSPASATRTLMAFEERLGIKLIERTTRRISPTEAGKRLAEHAKPLIRNYDEAIQDATSGSIVPRGVLRITAPLLFGRMHVLPAIKEFLGHYPDVNIELLLTNQTMELLENKIDLAIRIGKINDSLLVAKQMSQVRHILTASPEYLRRKGTPQGIEDLSSHDVILQTHDAKQDDWHFSLPSGGNVSVKLSPRLCVNQAEAAIQAALDGLGIIRTLSYQVSREVAEGRLKRICQRIEPPLVPVNILFPSRDLMPLRTRLFIDYLVGRFSNLRKKAWI